MANLSEPMAYMEVTGAFGNSPQFYAQFGQLGHNGKDLGTKQQQMSVHAVDDGVIEFEGWGQYHNWMGRIAGICVLIKHWWGYSGYAHLSNTIVNRGQSVKKKQRIGTSGATGVGTGPHLHLETLPLNPNFGNGFAGRVNPAIHSFSPLNGPVVPPKPPKTKEDTVAVHYHRQDKTARSKGRSINPGTGFYLHVEQNKPTGHASNCVGKVAFYTFVAHAYIEGTPGDTFELKYIWQNKGVNSPHYTETLTIPSSGKLRRSISFTRGVGAGDSVFLRLDALGGNKTAGKVTVLDSDATAWNVA